MTARPCRWCRRALRLILVAHRRQGIQAYALCDTCDRRDSIKNREDSP